MDGAKDPQFTVFYLLTDKSLIGDITQPDIPQDNPFGMYT